MQGLPGEEGQAVPGAVAFGFPARGDERTSAPTGAGCQGVSISNRPRSPRPMAEWGRASRKAHRKDARRPSGKINPAVDARILDQGEVTSV